MATRKNLTANRESLVHKVRYAASRPHRIAPYLKRAARDRWLAFKHPDHVSYYRAVMASDTRRNPEAAVGSQTHERWLALGRMQFDYLLGHGLKPGSRMLDIGCGNLRAGWHFIDYLDAGHYYGIDISPDILIAAKGTLTERGLQAKLPHLTITKNLTLDFLPEGHFDVVHAHSVFSHSPIDVIDECLAHVGRVLAPGVTSTSPSTAPPAPNTRCCARTSTTGPRPSSTSPPGTGWRHASWMTGRNSATVSPRSASA